MNLTHFEISNGRKDLLLVWLEPWAEMLEVPPGCTLKVAAQGEEPGTLTVELTESGGIVLYGWPSSSIKIFQGTAVYWESFAPVPSALTGQSVRSLVKDLFHADSDHNKPPPSAEQL